jgi:uncharacterized protein (DUF2062 family)
MARLFPKTMKRDAAEWLRQGISPQRLALTLALGFAIGCIPVIGIPTVLCAALAMSLRLNLPAIQFANYLAMPLQLFLMVPFVRMGGWLFAETQPRLTPQALVHSSPLDVAVQLGGITGHALMAWVLVAGPAVALLTLMLTGMLRRIPALAEAESGD